jgi:hypothetical protein
MTEVEQIQEETVEATPNPYNQNKSWHTDEVMPKHGDTAEGLFFERPQVSSEEGEEPVNTEAAPTKQQTHKRADYKKRYDDLKKHYDNSLTNFRTREQELLQQVTETQPDYVAPKTPEELEQFKSQYPDVYEVVESVAHLQSEEKLATLQGRLDAMQDRESEILKREAEKDLLTKHPDFDELRGSNEFHDWAESQPEEIKDWIYNNPNNATLASKAIDLFKAENGLPLEKSTTPKSRKDAADLVSTKTTQPADVTQPKIWTQKEIAALSMDEYDRMETEIDKALEEGRIIG